MSNRLLRFTDRFACLVFFRRGGCARERHLLEEHLQREAQAERPQFSADLHQHLCHAVRQVASQAPREPVPRGPAMVRPQVAKREPYSLPRVVLSHRMHIAWGGLGLAAAGVLLYAGWVVRLAGWGASTGAPESYPAGRAGDPTTSLATLATLPDRASGRIEQWLVVSMASGQWAYLEHDARLVGQWLVEDLPWKVPVGEAELESNPSSS